jgi:hypothetical protein
MAASEVMGALLELALVSFAEHATGRHMAAPEVSVSSAANIFVPDRRAVNNKGAQPNNRARSAASVEPAGSKRRFPIEQHRRRPRRPIRIGTAAAVHRLRIRDLQPPCIDSIEKTATRPQQSLQRKKSLHGQHESMGNAAILEGLVSGASGALSSRTALEDHVG